MSDMEKKQTMKILTVVSMLFGITIALMALFHTSAQVLGTVAIAGGVALGVLWTLTALFGRTTGD